MNLWPLGLFLLVLGLVLAIVYRRGHAAGRDSVCSASNPCAECRAQLKLPPRKS